MTHLATVTIDKDLVASDQTDFVVAASTIQIGKRQAGQYFNGGIDEVRVALTARSADWITTEYNNQSATSTFYSAVAAGGVPTLSDVQATLIGSTSITPRCDIDYP